MSENKNILQEWWISIRWLVVLCGIVSILSLLFVGFLIYKHKEDIGQIALYHCGEMISKEAQIVEREVDLLAAESFLNEKKQELKDKEDKLKAREQELVKLARK